MLVQVFPAFEMTVMFFPERVDGFLAGLAFVFVVYSMVTVGLIAAFEWDALTFELRDAMVLGPLPLSGRHIIAAKLLALATFLLGTSAAVNVVTGVPFGFVTANRFDLMTLIRNSAAFLAATIGASVFVFTAMMTLKGLVVFLAGPRFAERAGAWLQWFFVTSVLCFVILLFSLGPGGELRRSDPHGVVPVTWFVALFEEVRGSPVPEGRAFAGRALIAIAAGVVGAALVSIAGFRRQMRLALAPSALTGVLGTAPIARTLARAMAGGDERARATADFVLLSMTRSHAVQTPLAVNAAIGAAIVVATLGATSEPATGPRTAVLWIPMLMGYWIALGLRASFFVPSELRASWVFRVSGPLHMKPYWMGVHAALFGFLVPRTLLLSALLFPVLGWRVGSWHTLLVLAQTMVLVEAMALTVNHVPFTRPYDPGHARFKTRWPLYLVGMFVFAYWPARFEQISFENTVHLVAQVAVLVIGALVLHTWGRWSRNARMVEPVEEVSEEPYSSVTTLNLAGAS
jgi:hypothetical protein